MKRLFAILFVCALLLCGCGAKPAATTAAPAGTSQAPAATISGVVPETEPVETLPETEPAPTETTEKPILYRNPLNGQPLDEPYAGRPVAVVINNLRAALPHCGVSRADVIYEITAEGGVTRCLAVFSDLSQVEAIGSIRSARTYFISLARSYDAILVHHGDSTLAQAQFRQGLCDHLDGGEPWFYRNQERLAAGVSMEHTLFTTGEKLLECLTEKDFRLTAEPDDTYGVQFDEEASVSGQSAGTVTVKYAVGGKTNTLTYEEALGGYSLYQHKQDYVDGNTDEKVIFSNVLVLYAKMTNTGDSSGHVTHNLVGENKGYYACGGQMVPITWSRDSESAPFRYFLEDGTPLVLRPGISYIAIVPTNSTVTSE